MKNLCLILILLFLHSLGYAQKTATINEKFSFESSPTPPDYSQEKHWAALPQKQDNADKLPKNKINLIDNQANAPADVFFIHPTIFTYEPKGKNKWNGDVNDAELNQQVDETTILMQASTFNAVGKIYAPRYRQAHIYSYFTLDKESAKQAFELAYQDVKSAFEYYLQNYNQGRPIIIAAHSQGTQHGKQLLKDFFDGKALQKQLVVAYLVGMVTPANFFNQILPGTSAQQTGCFVNWRTFKKDYIPPQHFELGYDKCLSVNPLTWDTTSVWIDRKLHKGIVNQNFELSKPAIVGAKNHAGMLWIGKIHIPGSIFLATKNWHRADYNMFWLNIRENAKLRLEAFLGRKLGY
jgi:hypothetical protein